MTYDAGCERGEVGDHALWMCRETQRFLEEGLTLPEEAARQTAIEKAMRWLGFIQGSLFCLGVQTIDQMRLDNSPIKT